MLAYVDLCFQYGTVCSLVSRTYSLRITLTVIKMSELSTNTNKNCATGLLNLWQISKEYSPNIDTRFEGAKLKQFSPFIVSHDVSPLPNFDLFPDL